MSWTVPASLTQKFSTMLWKLLTSMSDFDSYSNVMFPQSIEILFTMAIWYAIFSLYALFVMKH